MCRIIHLRKDLGKPYSSFTEANAGLPRRKGWLIASTEIRWFWRGRNVGVERFPSAKKNCKSSRRLHQRQASGRSRTLATTPGSFIHPPALWRITSPLIRPRQTFIPLHPRLNPTLSRGGGKLNVIEANLARGAKQADAQNRLTSGRRHRNRLCYLAPGRIALERPDQPVA